MRIRKYRICTANFLSPVRERLRLFQILTRREITQSATRHKKTFASGLSGQWTDGLPKPTLTSLARFVFLKVRRFIFLYLGYVFVPPFLSPQGPGRRIAGRETFRQRLIDHLFGKSFIIGIIGRSLHRLLPVQPIIGAIGGSRPVMAVLFAQGRHMSAATL